MSKDACIDQSSPHGNLAAAIYAELAELAEPPGPEWKRKHARSDVRVALEVEIEGKVLRAHTQNVTPNSMCVICKAAAKPQTTIRVRRTLPDSGWSEGRVRHCTATFGAHKIGIEFESSSQTEQGNSSNCV